MTNDNSKTIVILTRSLVSYVGGVEKSTVNLANTLSDLGFDVCLITLDQEESKSFFNLNKMIKWHRIGTTDPINTASIRIKLNRIKSIRKILKKLNQPTLLAFQANSGLQLRISALAMGLKIIILERNSPYEVYSSDRGNLRKIYHSLSLLTANQIVVFFENFKNSYPNILRKKIIVIPNFIQTCTHLQKEITEPGKIKILFIGRLAPEKNIEILVKAVKESRNNVCLTIVGDGELKKSLDNMIRNAKNIKIIEPQKNLCRIYLSHDFLIIQSKYEGFPNVVAEAIAHYLPVLSFKQTSGVFDLIKNYNLGYKIEGEINIENLVIGILKMIELRNNNFEFDLIMEKFNKDLYKKNWMTLLEVH